nr:hypothetical protein [uncultured Fluviicola sp.]
MKNFLSFVIIAISFSSIGQQKLELKDVDQSKLLKDITFSKTENGEIVVLYWFPNIYWEMLSAKDPKTYSPEMVTQLKEMLGNKSIFMAVSGKLNSTTQKFDVKPDSYLRNNFSVTFKGKSYKPIPESKLSEELLMLNDFIKPMFSRMLGDLGSGMSMLYVEIADNPNETLLDPYADVDFGMELNSFKNTFHMPLPSLFQDSKCANDGELFPANYEFCPYHGSKLIAQ